MENKNTLLLVDDDSDLRSSLKLILKNHFSIKEAASAEEALKVLSKGPTDVILLDIGLPGISGIEALRHIKGMFPQIEVIMLTANSDLQSAVQATKLGAFDFISKPYNTEHLINVCRHAAERVQLKIESEQMKIELDQSHANAILGQGPAILKINQTIKKVADKDTTVLITGETGTGKEVVARTIHRQSNRRLKPFIAINCGGIPADLLESELFGHEQGAFTSAVHTKVGKFELAQGGTLFLDELGNMPYSMQAKLLRVLQEREIERVGGTTPIQIDVRIVAATNENLKDLIQAEKFRKDLFYRLNVVPLELPPLRQRLEDLEILSMHFLEKLGKKITHDFKYLSPS
jgi:DNA-binding NtrC family response regulator